MTARHTLFVAGDPKGQPRPRACIRGRHAGVYDPGTADGWKQTIALAFNHVVAPMNGPVYVSLRFLFARPASHLRRDGTVRPSAPAHHVGHPDVDNLSKAVLDVLTTLRVWHDDAQVVLLTVSKGYANPWDEMAGCDITIGE